jgi:hypothetical protein
MTVPGEINDRIRGCHGRDCMVVGFTTTCKAVPITTKLCEFESPSWRNGLGTTLCDKVCQWLATGLWFSPVSPTNKTDRRDITEILLKVALNTVTLMKEYEQWDIKKQKFVSYSLL